MSVFYLVRTVRFITISFLVGSALVAVFIAWCLASLALWIAKSFSVSVSPEAPVQETTPLLSNDSAKFLLTGVSALSPTTRIGRYTASLAFESVRLQFAALGLGFAACDRVLITPIRLALPAAIKTPDADFEGYAEWLEEREAIIEADADITPAPVSVQINEVLSFAKSVSFESNKEAIEQTYKVEPSLDTKAIARVRKQKTADLSKLTVTQLRKLAKERGLTRISKLRKDELITALV